MAPLNRQTELMEKARNGATFDANKLACIIYNGEEVVRCRREAFKRVEEATGCSDPSKLPIFYANTDREALYLGGAEAGTAAFVDGIRNKHDFFDSVDQRYTLSNCTPYGLHYMMFLPTIELQGSKEQVEYWAPLAKQGKICGCYLQTELAHGTFVRGMETTATLDIGRDEFVINSPALTSAKFWPGAMASSCTHGILMARLIIQGIDYGVHAFIMPLRNLDDFKPVPGAEFGDLGMKMGYNGTTNGYAMFRNVRIPRNYLLMRNVKVTRDGTYTRAQHDKTSYLTMLHARAVIAANSGFKLAQAATIATRYSVVREQGAGFNGEATGDGSELPIIRYRSQNFRLFTIISRAYAIHFTGRKLQGLADSLKSIMPKNDFGSMALYHVLLAGYKAWNTQIAADGAEDARKACGGHGFALTSGLPSIVAEATAPATFEGENYVMYQQVGRFLVKCWKALKAGGQIDRRLNTIRRGFDQLFSKSLPQQCQAAGSHFLDVHVQVSIFQHRAFSVLDKCSEGLEQAEKAGLKPVDAWNKHMMDAIAAGRGYMELLVLEDFIEGVEATRLVDQAVHTALSRLRSIFALTTIAHPQSYDAISFVAHGYLDASQMKDIRGCIDGVLDELLPDAIALTDAWDFTDASLSSAIGQYDGNVYETLMSWTRQMPINKNLDSNQGTCKYAWERWIKPALSPELRTRL
ncbi:hypothetical protein FQN57_006153 [Myotisia sp. PD_48]|nr:hypothetical protein FQN57_006153 [Myotisia sp. PD_48]